MAFLYRLEALLRLQRSIEHQEENRLLACTAKVAALRNDLREMENMRLERELCVQEELRSGAPGVILQVLADWKAGFQQKAKSIYREIDAAEKIRLLQVSVHRKARQKREVLEGLKEKQQSAYNLEQTRRIQQTMDEAFLMQTSYHKSS